MLWSTLSHGNDECLRGTTQNVPGFRRCCPNIVVCCLVSAFLSWNTADPKIKGVVLYISNFDRPITEKLGGNFFNDPAYASVACAKTGKDVAIADNIAKGLQGEEVFEESRSLLFKTLRVQRIYDTESNTVVYVSYNTRFDKSDDTNKSRFKSSLCAVNLNEQ